MGSPIESMLVSAMRELVPRDLVMQEVTERTRLELGDTLPHNAYPRLVEKPDARHLGPGSVRASTIYGEHEDSSAWHWFAVHREVVVGSYRLDLALNVGFLWLAVECDGHEWHERTKQQAANDRARDRELLRMGIRTIRFTGSEIVHAVDRCALEVFECARLLCREELQQHAEFCGAYNSGRAARSA